MKKLFTLICLLAVVLGTQAQEELQEPQEPQATQQPAQSIVLQPVMRMGNKYYYDGFNMNQNVSYLSDHAPYTLFLKESCPEAYVQYISGRNYAIEGWCCFTIGIIAEALPIGFTWTARTGDGRTTTYKTPLGWTLSYLTAAALQIACIPLLAIGYKRMHESVNVYNISTAGKTVAPTVSFNATEDGVGLALRF